MRKIPEHLPPYFISVMVILVIAGFTAYIGMIDDIKLYFLDSMAQIPKKILDLVLTVFAMSKKRLLIIIQLRKSLPPCDFNFRAFCKLE